MPLEIERVYLLTGMPTLPAGADAIRIAQGYLPPAADPEFSEGRLRRIERADGSVEFRHTIKTGTGLVRTEVERVIGAEAFERQWPRTASRRLSKTRHRVREGPLVWEIDAFDAIDLVLAEVELPTPEFVAPIPAWLAPLVVREVTDEPEYRNFQIALRAREMESRNSREPRRRE